MISHAVRTPLSLVLLASLLPAQLTTPEAHLGRPVAADFQLADWGEVSGYFRRLAEESPRIELEVVGQTTEGRDFLLATIGSEENLARLEEIRGAARRIADPRGLDEAGREALFERAVPIVFVSLGMHSNETAAPQFGMELAYRLATSDEEPYALARERCIVLVAPCLNPDGLDHVVSWYRETVGTPFEASGLPRLYQHYAGHDNNRDWFCLTQNETRIVTRLLYSRWFPQIYWDVHQQGKSRERFFVPPFRDPLNPNLDPGVIAGIDQLGTRALFDMTRAGLTGVSSGVTYDMWWNGGNRNVPVRHNIIGLLTEAASVDVASPVFLPFARLSGPRGIGGYAPSNRFPAPWPGGWWRLRDIVDYEHAFARSLLASVAREPRVWLENALEAAERAIAKGRADAPRAWLLPSDEPNRAAARRLVDTLLSGGVEVEVARTDFVADGREWPAGTIVVRRDQPYGQHVKDLFEVQRYPEGDAPYDVAGWTLPLLFGVRRVEVVGALEVESQRVTSSEDALAGFPEFSGGPGTLDLRDGDSWRSAFRALAGGESVRFDSEAATLEIGAGGDGALERMPRIGVYAPWAPSMDEGWMRWVLDSFHVPYRTVRNEMLRAGELGDFLDVLVVPSIRGRTLQDGRAPGTVQPDYAGGLGPEGAAAVDDFVRGGGTLVAIDRAAAWAIELFDLPLSDVTRSEEAGDFGCPGSLLRAVPEPSEELTAGLDDSLALFFASSAAWEVEDDADESSDDAPAAVDVLLRFAPTHVLLSGWIRSPETIAGRAAWVRARHGAGRAHLFSFRPQYRGWSEGTFPLLFRALLDG